MKKLIMILMMVFVASGVNAQSRYSGNSNAVYRMQTYAYQMNINRILSQNNTVGYSENDLPFMRHFIIFGFGIGGGSINPSGKMSHGSFDMDLIAMNALISVKFGTMKDTSNDDEVSLSDGGTSLQLGFLIPVFDFDKKESGLREQSKGKIFVAPIIGFIDADDTTFDGHKLHKSTKYHHCQIWVSDNHVEEHSCTEYGGAILVKHGCGYLMGKVTNKSWGITIGLCY